MKKELTAIGVAILLATGIGTTAALNSASNSSLQSQVNQLSQQLSKAEAELSQATSKLNAQSTTGDLITCNDLRNLGLQNVDNFATLQSDGSIFINQQPVTIPQHCYKSLP